jgi:hypothetical protein
MNESKDPSRKQSETPGAERADSRKPWAAPYLKILPVPGTTRGGAGKKADQDDGVFYKIS